eukprot:Sro438_g143100.1 n/a (423) ;mRNA; r:46954-48222
MEEFFNTDHDNLTLSSKTIEAIAGLCWAFNESNTHSTVDVRMLYKSKNVSQGDPESSLRQFLENYDCHTYFQSEDELWTKREGENKDQFLTQFKGFNRYKRLAMLRSEQRRQILEASKGHNGYDVVVNVDMDVVTLPPIVPLLDAMEGVADNRASAVGSVVCAIGIENWNIANGWFRNSLYYDTFATVLDDGTWGYTLYTLDAREQLKFSQTLFLKDILQRLENPRKQDQMFHMQSCFGGVALYDFDTWATPECDYDRDTINLKVEQANNQDAAEHRIFSSRWLGSSPRESPNDKLHQLQEFKGNTKGWTLDPKYFTSDGNACEHVVFQQCLYDANREKSTMNNKRQLNIGIQPDLIIEREAAVMNRWEDYGNVAMSALRAVAALTGFAMILFPLLRYLLFPKRNKSALIMDQIHTKTSHDD